MKETMFKTDKLAYTLNQAAAAINVSRPTMTQLAQRKDFPAIKVGRKWLIPVHGFELWLEQQAGVLQEQNSLAG